MPQPFQPWIIAGQEDLRRLDERIEVQSSKSVENHRSCVPNNGRGSKSVGHKKITAPFSTYESRKTLCVRRTTTLA
jgi:hypothetical protein